jgi:hypothetical protein
MMGLPAWVEVRLDEVVLREVDEVLPGARVVTARPVDEEDCETDGGWWPLGAVDFVMV